jgi:hypothetical protein
VFFWSGFFVDKVERNTQPNLKAELKENQRFMMCGILNPFLSSASGLSLEVASQLDSA